ncbi:S8 family serine peptidase [Roseiterribacter gracilis]|uniref:P/Homo B domain-containing protein n=1 Tax=Roseiterribacter gracilis TaxID=2812848 RepID=A0A8S8XAH2_9PROT|nr:hypothetical protein TMPK1_03730 [Rhodospirillales bacterium TMPK1]
MVAMNDPSFGSEWALGAGAWSLNVQPVWARGYTGKGIRVAVIDNGVQYTHPDLAPNYDAAHSYSYRDNVADAGPKTSSDSHGTLVAGTIAAAANGTDAVGVAYDATILSYQIGYGSAGSPTQYANAIKAAALNADIANNSWSYTTQFQDNFFGFSFAAAKAAVEQAANQGRNGLGTILVFSAGNNAGAGDDTNYHSFQNAPSIISVAATDSSGALWSGSTRGESILIAAPGANIVTSDLMGSSGYGSGNVATVSGTSLAAPELSGVVALMLDANPNLGWRDVQDILALTARQNVPTQATWRWNGATDWNGGARHFSNNYGFGLVDAAAAVRVAETWTQSQVSSNQAHSSITVSSALTIPDNGTVKSTVANSSHIAVEKAVVDLNLAHMDLGDLIVTLTSPKGTVATLMNRPGVTGSNTNGVTSPPTLSFEFSANTFWGESADGNWTLTVTDAHGNNIAGALNSWTLRLDGDAAAATKTVYYTDEFATLGLTSRQLLNTGGATVVNAAALSGNATFDLAHNSAIIAGKPLTVAAGTVVTQLFTGDGNDTITASDVGVWIDAGRGANTIKGGSGADTFVVRGSGDVIDGGAGNDTAVFTGKFADYTITAAGTGVLISGNGVSATLAHVETLKFSDTVYNVPQPTTPPIALADAVATTQEAPVTFAPLANDTPTPGATMHVGSTSAAAHGTIIKNADDTLTYRPNAGYVGADSFTYTIVDGLGGSSTATVTVQVGAVTPVANNDTASTKNATPVTLALLANDSDPVGNSLTVSAIVTGPTHGSVVINADKTVTYTPDAAWSGADSFTYVIDNGHGGTASALATINVAAPVVTTPPDGGGTPTLTLTPDTVFAMKDAALPIYPLANDAAGLHFNAIETGPAHGQIVVGLNNELVYLADAGYTGSDSFVYSAKDATGATGTATVSITVASALPSGTLKGTGSGATIVGGANNEILTGSGTDVLQGGGGNDNYFVSTSKTTVAEGASSGNDTIFSTVSYAAPGNVENVVTYYTGYVVATGNDQNNILALRGSGQMVGGAGDDLLIAGVGAAEMNGGAGADKFVLRAGSVGSKITDFQAGVDQLDLHLLPGLGSDPIASGVLKAIANSTSTEIWYDADGTAGAGAAVKLLTLSNFAPGGLTGHWWG